MVHCLKAFNTVSLLICEPPRWRIYKVERSFRVRKVGSSIPGQVKSKTENLHRLLPWLAFII